jgi:hypothetical protein
LSLKYDNVAFSRRKGVNEKAKEMSRTKGQRKSKKGSKKDFFFLLFLELPFPRWKSQVRRDRHNNRTKPFRKKQFR